MLLVARQGDGCCEAESGTALVQGRKLVLYPPSQTATGVNPWMNASRVTLRSLAAFAEASAAHRPARRMASAGGSLGGGWGEGGYASAGYAEVMWRRHGSPAFVAEATSAEWDKAVGLHIAPAVGIARELQKGDGLTHGTRTRQGPQRAQEAPEKHSASESAGEGEADETSETVGHQGNDHFDKVSRASDDVTPSDYVCPETSSAS